LSEIKGYEVFWVDSRRARDRAMISSTRRVAKQDPFNYDPASPIRRLFRRLP